MANAIDLLKKKYEEYWVPEKYLEKYSSLTNPWELGFVTGLHDTINKGRIKGSRGIDIGCGPTVHRMAILGRVCDEILACDYTQSNIDFVSKFLKGEDSEALCETLQMVAKFEGHSNMAEGQQIIQDRLRSKVKQVVHCDLTDDDSVNNLLQYGGQYDCAVSNGCLESACLTYESYAAILKRIQGILKPGAAFALSGHLLGDYYVVNNVKMECFRLDAEMVKKGLLEAGFIIDSIAIFDLDITKHTDCTNGSTTFFCLAFKL